MLDEVWAGISSGLSGSDGGALSPAGSPNLVPALVRGLQLMQAFSTARPKLQMSELVAYVDAPRSTVARLVRSLVALGFLVADDAGRLSPGPAVLGIGASYLVGAEAVQIASAIIEELANQTLAAAQLLAVDGAEVVVLAQALPVAVRGACAVTRVGARFAIGGTGLRVWLSGLADGGSAGGQCATVADGGEWTPGDVVAGGGRSDDVNALPLMAAPILRSGRVVYALSVGVQEGVDAVSMVERAALGVTHAAERFARALNG
ncbi:helix-turn-helix domain-containing protein [Paraburkholderia elongata]|uniref:Helix-turn-helix domain-containing protein n=1 Tax=Paraburkholderia elongata TaxID=2675747 RepID=A0A972NR02_9BURK|nr:helix-turn-helix domain-containing protein [Paraburkholderia elongata]NPT57436.1 helix-turn-helix domain-containing protein [Paraburkholderia elongata]